MKERWVALHDPMYQVRTMFDTTSQTTEVDVVRLGRLLYERALVRRSQEPITDPRGHPIGWLLDTRIPTLDGQVFNEVGRVLADKLRMRGIDQVAGFGYGAFPIVCSVLSASNGDGFCGGFVRERKKPYGRQRLVEGPLERLRPVVLVDDILNSGRSAVRSIALLRGDGFHVVGLMTLFHFSWGGGRRRVESEGVWVESLLDLHLREDNTSTGPAFSMQS